MAILPWRMTVRSECVLIFVFFLYLPTINGVRNSTLELPLRDDVKEGCQALLEKFASSVGLFTFCAIKHARPIRLCERCIDTYLDVLNDHNEILQLRDHSGTVCKLELINLDRLEVIESTFQNVKDLWMKGHCDTCFVFTKEKLTSDLSNDTKEFQALFDSTDACFQQYINETSKNITSDVCEDCKEIYCKMNELYNSMKEEDMDIGICIDIVDAMNSTRTKWSQQFGCTLNTMQMDLPFVISGLIVSLTPVVFYVAAKIFSIKAETRVLEQSRLSKYLSFPSTSHLGT